jgi:hypothetical protein
MISMLENFELGLNQSSGDYVTCIGDDDAIVPSARTMCDQHFEQNSLMPLAWYRKAYFWNNAPFNKNKLFVEKPKQNQVIMRANKLHELRENSVHHNDLPSFYNAFHPATYLDHLKIINNKLSASPTIFPNNDALMPDLFSAVQSIYCMKTDYTLAGYPVSLSGISGASNGASYEANSSARLKFEQESRIGSITEYCGRTLVPSISGQMTNAAVHAYAHIVYSTLINMAWQPNEKWIENLCQAYIHCESHNSPLNAIDYVQLARKYNARPSSLIDLKKIYQSGIQSMTEEEKDIHDEELEFFIKELDEIKLEDSSISFEDLDTEPINLEFEEL